jgi:hypothetical protein
MPQITNNLRHAPSVSVTASVNLRHFSRSAPQIEGYAPRISRRLALEYLRMPQVERLTPQIASLLRLEEKNLPQIVRVLRHISRGERLTRPIRGSGSPARRVEGDDLRRGF